ncbi:arylsulfatase B-like [Plodia interpunctella]|uniref:arylsulfatase B-like n=1 Tax=Plodia interpunctella TaxID=58824 RepID=UPI00236816A9|nr:arylsulfatase B-like [Plodia interpunctella]
MLIKVIYFVTLFMVTNSEKNEEENQKPHIVFIVADDLGWNDVSFHGSDLIMTPNIDVLAYEGVILNQYYTDTQGTSSISALFTGKYPMRLGTQGASISACEDRGIPISERLLPAYLQELGYSTHLVGKWNVGKSREHYLPTLRGFDTFYGFHGSSVDYYTYNLIETCDGKEFFGLNFFDNLDSVQNLRGHLTEIITDEAVQIIREHNTSTPLYLHISQASPHAGGGLVNLQPPVESIAANEHIAHSARRLYAGQVTSLDRSVGQIVAALAEKDILQNTIILFVSDNGAAPIGHSQNFGSNLPLRGIKGTPWEGAARSIGLIWQAAISPKVYDGLFHVSDWLPTLMNAAGGNIVKGIDGTNQWDAIINDEEIKRNDLLITIDDLNGWAAFREGDFKIIVGDVPKNISNYHGKEFDATRSDVPTYETLLYECDTARVLRETLNLILDIDLAFIKRNESVSANFADNIENLCYPTKDKGCLFNITEDPYEQNDLWYTSHDVVRHMTLRLRTLWTEAKPRREPQLNLRADPSTNNYIWFSFVENDEVTDESPLAMPTFPLRVSLGEVQYLVNLNLGMLKNKMNDYITSMGESFVKSVKGLFAF